MTTSTTGEAPVVLPLDLLVVGSGVAGLSAAVRAAAHAPGLRVGVVSKGELSDSATQWAQGGVAAVLCASGRPEPGDSGPGRPALGDSVELHLSDTLAAGAGLCDVDAVRVLVSEGPGRVRELVELGAVFDRDPDGSLALAREGGHSTARVVHAGGAATGAEIERALVEAARRRATAIWEGCFADDLIVEAGRCVGVVATDPAGRRIEIRAGATLLATGGAGQLFAQTTNPHGSTGDGLAMALRAGVACADLEFVQFHPTALVHPAGGPDWSPRPLLSEALRGEGAVLRDVHGARFVDELARRDVVSQAMTAKMADQGADHLWLDARSIVDFTGAFPTLAAVLAGAGLDPATDWLPVAPAAHYLCGVLTDLDGATTLPGLWAAGEVACSGVHGANRLASNSLLEGMVFAARVIDGISGGKRGPSPTGALRPLIEGWPPGRGGAGAPTSTARTSVTPVTAGAIGCSRLARPRPVAAAPGAAPFDATKRREELQRLMTANAGVLRSAESLDEVARRSAESLDEVARRTATFGPALAGAVDERELTNLSTVAAALVAAATARTESRGTHSRSDFPFPTDAMLRRFVS